MKKHTKTYSKNFTDAQLEKVVKLHLSGTGWAKIAEKCNKDWMLSNSEDVYRGLFRRFGSVIIQKLKSKAEPHPLAHFTRDAMGDIKKKAKRKKRYFITAVGAAAKLHQEAFDAVLNFCQRENAELILMPMCAHVKALEDQPDHYPHQLEEYMSSFATEYTFNSNIKALELRLNPQQTSPLTGLGRIRGRDAESEASEFDELISNYKKTSIIVAHSKQDMEPLATGNGTLPRIIHSTGCITLPNYQNNRIGIIAKEDHILGGLILEIVEDYFFITQVQFNKRNGSFIDKYANRFYANGDVKKERAKAFVMGDIHPGMESKKALKAWEEVWEHTQPEKIFLHDWMDGLSISHHVENRKITKALRPAQYQALQAEFDYTEKCLADIKKAAPEDSEILLVASNHPEHVHRFLEEGRYMKDPVNYALGHRMVVEILDGKDPVKLRLDPNNDYTWLDRNSDYIVEGTQVGSHGDIGMNGAKGSIKNNENVYSSSMTAHTHTPRISHGAYVVGHSSNERHGYNEGPSSWLWSSGLIYKGGHKQLIICIKGNWKI